MTGRFGSFQSGLFFIENVLDEKLGLSDIRIQAAPEEFVGLCLTFERVVLDEPLSVDDRKALQAIREGLMVMIARLPDKDFNQFCGPAQKQFINRCRSDFGPDANKEDRR